MLNVKYVTKFNSWRNLEKHAKEEHITELTKVEEKFNEYEEESRKIMEDVPESDYILTPEEITILGIDWKIHLEVLGILSNRNTKELIAEE